MDGEAGDETVRTRFAVVVFADVSGSTQIYEKQGDTVGHRTVGAAVEAMRKATAGAGGRVVKTIGDEVMAAFGSADAAARAAVQMHVLVGELPEVAGTRLALRIGFHGGPVLQKANDIFGDTVNLAARLAGQAQAGQIITSRETAETLGPEMQLMARHLYGVNLKGKSEEIELCELVWRIDGAATVVLSKLRPKPAAKPSVLKLTYQGRALVRRRDGDKIVLGRDADCELPVGDTMASRRHCTIERRGDKWVLKDHSTNGTYVTIEGEQELWLRREELTLLRRGRIGTGQSAAGTDEVVEFSCE